ncbi:hypothetical protein BDZ91DRAFT_728044 [Kalaharituber pfeilii]|nr:hypothetical protein BDZ91DRAFT_728044 [Kalaharituber pfeilii]
MMEVELGEWESSASDDNTAIYIAFLLFLTQVDAFQVLLIAGVVWIEAGVVYG